MTFKNNYALFDIYLVECSNNRDVEHLFRLHIICRTTRQFITNITDVPSPFQVNHPSTGKCLAVRSFASTLLLFSLQINDCRIRKMCREMYLVQSYNCHDLPKPSWFYRFSSTEIQTFHAKPLFSECTHELMMYLTAIVWLVL